MSLALDAGDTAFLGRWFTGARREGFLARLSPETWHTLSGVLSFTASSGQRLFSLEQLAITLGIPREAAQVRLATLADCTWKGLPLLTVILDGDGSVAGAQLCPIELFARIQLPSISEDGDEADVGEGLNGLLAATGLNPAQIDSLRRRFSRAEIQRQLRWLPARAARNPAALLIRAIEQSWEEPKEDA